MTQQRGANADIMIGFESTYGTAPSAGYILPVNSCGVVGTKARNTPATLTGTRNPVEPFTGNQDAAGPIVVPADSIGMAHWLAAMFGDPISTGADPFVHEYKIAASQPSFTIEKAFEDLATDVFERITGCKISSFGMTVGGDGELVCNMDVLGSEQTEESSSMDATPDTISIARVNNAEAAILEGGGSLANATELSLNIDFGLDPNSFVIGGGGVRGDIPEGIVAVTGNLQTLFESDTLLAKAIADTESSLKVTITGSASSILEFEIQELLYAVNGIPVEGPQGLLVNLDFAGYYANGSEASAIVARVTNGVASYDLIP